MVSFIDVLFIYLQSVVEDEGFESLPFTIQLLISVLSLKENDDESIEMIIVGMKALTTDSLPKLAYHSDDPEYVQDEFG